MGRWEPNARGRLERAALDLYVERGFDQTTVAEIASRAGLTERTFFRHFADKREVLFGKTSALQELFVRSVTEAPVGTAPIDAVAGALLAAAAALTDRDYSIRRQRAINADTGLRERELIKLAALADGIAGALRERGIPDPAASLAAEAAIAVFKIAFESWVTHQQGRTLAELIGQSLETLRAVATGG